MARKDLTRILIRVIRATLADIFRSEKVAFNKVMVDEGKLAYRFSFGLDNEVEMSGRAMVTVNVKPNNDQLRQLEQAMVNEWEGLISGINEVGPSMDVEKKDCSVSCSDGKTVVVTFKLSAD